ncbi:ABC transporter permease [Nodosilinea sp. E11]|uniref:ABC transporter permease n=1 Tax=Nodosilinea sp. E11 TaxID=3037479 RepID=UPI002934D047|nr:ABC transporter permease [Nodosilinea sp. E11]WOD39520.1 ABC transporter permease [Nodosilinea sp. E11]
MNKFLKTKLAAYLLPSVALVLLLIIWEGVTRVLEVPTFILPAPSDIWLAAQAYGTTVWRNGLHTLNTTLIGFLMGLVLGVFLGFLIGYSRLAYIVLYPLLVGFNTIPKVALVPLLAIWFGIGAMPAIITAFTLAFFPIVVNVAAGLATVEPEMQDVLRSLGASPWEVFQKVGFPHSLPYLFASLKVAISQAFIGSVISETVASNRGIGYVIVTASSSFNVPLAFLAILALAAMGILLYGCFALIEQRTIHWAR